jgi:hypothetical protein
MVNRLNKRGQDLSIGTLILIVLGIVVLVLLILGFSLGWSNLWEKINIFGGGSSIGEVSTRCRLDVDSQNTYDYCQDFKTVKVSGKTEYLNCLDTRIQTSLTTRLEGGCEGKTADVMALEYCNANVNNFLKADTDKVKINGKEYKRQLISPSDTVAYDCVLA